jgi:hypothetical protein
MNLALRNIISAFAVTGRALPRKQVALDGYGIHAKTATAFVAGPNKTIREIQVFYCGLPAKICLLAPNHVEPDGKLPCFWSA